MPTRRPRQDRSAQYADPIYKDLLRRVAVSVRRLREDQNLSQEDAAHRCNMDARMLQLVEAGSTNVTFTTLARLARGLDVDAADLLGKPRTSRRSTRKPKP